MSQWEVRGLQDRDSETHLLLAVTGLLTHTHTHAQSKAVNNDEANVNDTKLPVCPNLLLPVEDSNNDEDEDAHSDQCNGCEQHAVARSQVQLSTPSIERQSV